jgi:acyl carrier protein
MVDIAQVVRTFIIDSFLFGDDSNLSDHTSFMESRIVDSTGLLELVEFLEETFKIRVEDEELIPENLDCIDSVKAFISRKTAA